MNPNVQVAAITVLTTLITTVGVISVALINKQKEREKAVEATAAGIDPEMDEAEILDRLLTLIAENERKKDTIRDLRKKNRQLNKDLADLRARYNFENNILDD